MNRLEDFRAFLNKQELNKKTIYEYEREVNRFYLWYEKTNNNSLVVSNLLEKDLLDYRSYLLMVRKLAPSTINKKLAGLRKWLHFLQRQGIWLKEINVPDIKQQKNNRAPKWLKPSEVSAVLYGIEQTKNEFLQARDRCMIYFCLYAGLRIGEVMSLQLDDLVLTPGKQKIIIREGKGNKYGEVPLVSKKLRKAINVWIKERASSQFAQSSYLFVSLRASKITIGTVNKMVERIKRNGNVDFTTHQLRHTFAYHIQDITGDIRRTQELLRHSNINTTAIYTQPSEDDLRNILSDIDNRL